MPAPPLTSPYAPGPNRMNDAFRIADLIRRRGYSEAAGTGRTAMNVAALVGGAGEMVFDSLQRQDDRRKQAHEAEAIADLLASGTADPVEIIRRVGLDRAKQIFPMVESSLARRQAAEDRRKAEGKEATKTAARQTFATALEAPTADQLGAARAYYAATGEAPPSGLLTDPKVAADAAAKAALDQKAAAKAEAQRNAAAALAQPGANTAAIKRDYFAAVGEALPESLAPAPKTYQVTVPGPGGPVSRLATEAEMQQGVREYRAPTGGGNEVGWSFQTVTDPTTNESSLMRMNSRTGAAEPVTLPGGLQPGGPRPPRLTGAQQEDLATMQTVLDLSAKAVETGDQIGWKGVGGLGTGAVTGFLAKNLGMGTTDEEKLRNYIGNIQGTIAKLRGGTAFSAAEKEMLDSYTPGINDADIVIKSKLASLGDFIAIKRRNTLQVAGARPDASPSAVPDGVKRALANEPPGGPYTLANGTRWKKNTDGSITAVP